jgi:cytoplasmic iron level regulating protein YaaA (DUF328/UPF0246 family)
MLMIISPAKTMQEGSAKSFQDTTLPQYLEKTRLLADELKKIPASELAPVMKISPRLAQLNAGRFRQWKAAKHMEAGTPALFSYQGEVFRGIDVATFEADDWQYAQKHLRILSGFYGILRPLDLVLPYRLEMGGRFSPAGYRNLYDFWEEAIAKSLDGALSAQGDRTLINLASNEYFKSIDKKHHSMQVITPVFKESRGVGFKMVTIYAKKARGMMARFVIKNQITNPDDLKFFDENGYYYNESLSKGGEIVFTR